MDILSKVSLIGHLLFALCPLSIVNITNVYLSVMRKLESSENVGTHDMTL